MFTDFFNHSCDIYHIVEKSSSIGYGFDNAEDISYDYPENPDISSLSCHFHSKTNSVSINQEQPFNKVTVSRKLSLPLGTDVRVNDKIVDCKTGIEYTASIPVQIQNHHLTVMLMKTERQKIL